MSDVAVIVAARNQGRWLGDALHSLTRQSRPAAEIIYADDGSEDDSCSVAARLPCVRVLRLEHCGVAAARNAAYEALRSAVNQVPYVLFFDGDDIASEDLLRDGVAALDADLSAAVAYPRILIFEESAAGHRVRPWINGQDYHADRLPEQNVVPSPAVMRREAFEAAGRWQEVPAGTYWDWWLWLRIKRGGWGFAKLPESGFILYRHHEAQNSRGRQSERWAAYQWVQAHLPVTVVTAFAPGRPWSLNLWTENLRQSGLPLDRAHLVAVDNMHDSGLSLRLNELLEALRPAAWTVMPFDDVTRGESLAPRRNGKVTDFMCALWRRALPLCDGDLLWSLEDDVQLRGGDYPRLVSALRPHVGIVGSPAVSRWRTPLETMVRRLASREPYGLAVLPNGRNDYRGLSLCGVEQVGQVSMCSTLIRRSVYAGHAPMSSPNGDGRFSGHEFSLMRRCVASGRDVLCHWGTPVDHMLDAERGLTVDMWRRELARPDYYDRPMEVGRIDEPPRL